MNLSVTIEAEDLVPQVELFGEKCKCGFVFLFNGVTPQHGKQIALTPQQAKV